MNLTSSQQLPPDLAHAIDLEVVRRILGWKLPATAHTGFVLDALEQGCMPAAAGPAIASIRYTKRLAGAGIGPSVGSVGNSYDNALGRDNQKG